MGTHHHHCIRAFASRLAFQVGLRGGQARHRGPHQDGGAGACAIEDNMQLHQSRLWSTLMQADFKGEATKQMRGYRGDDAYPIRASSFRDRCFELGGGRTRRGRHDRVRLVNRKLLDWERRALNTRGIDEHIQATDKTPRA